MALLSNAFGDQRIEGQSLDDRRYAHRVEALSPLDDGGVDHGVPHVGIV